MFKFLKDWSDSCVKALNSAKAVVHNATLVSRGALPMSMLKPTCLVLWRGVSPATGEDIFISAHSLNHSSNRKTGPMLQTYAWGEHIEPKEDFGRLRLGFSASVCFIETCSFALLGGCYVQKTHFKGWWSAAKISPMYVSDMHSYLFKGKRVRFGTHGEIALMPEYLIKEIVALSDGYTGYTSLWRLPEFRWLKDYFQASVQTPSAYRAAKKLGFSTYRVRASASSPLFDGEILCPYELNENDKCFACLLCNGKNDVVVTYNSNQRVENTGVRDLVLACEKLNKAPRLA